jgi:hypothetical protein
VLFFRGISCYLVVWFFPTAKPHEAARKGQDQKSWCFLCVLASWREEHIRAKSQRQRVFSWRFVYFVVSDLFLEPRNTRPDVKDLEGPEPAAFPEVHADGDGDGVYLVVVVAVGERAGFVDEVLVPAAGYEADAAFFGEGYPWEGTRDLGRLNFYASEVPSVE